MASKNEPDQHCKCESCLKPVMENDDAVECELCDYWFHVRCQGISDQLYKTLRKFKTVVHWFCRGCRAGAEKVLLATSRLQKKIRQSRGRDGPPERAFRLELDSQT